MLVPVMGQATAGTDPVVAEAVRRLDGLSVREAAEALGIPRSTWHRVATGRQRPGNDHLNAICNAFPDLWLLRMDHGRKLGAA
jgi:transcriptional regulator with XRE-family HTH domain